MQLKKHLNSLFLFLSIFYTNICFSKTKEIENVDKLYNSSAQKFDFFLYSVKTIFFLIIIISVIFLLKKFFINKKIFNSNSFYRMITFFPIAQNKFIYVVEMYNELYFLGVTENSINVIDKITNKEKRDEILLNYSIENKTKFNVFDSYLKNKTSHVKEDKNEKKDFDISSHIEKLKSMKIDE